MEMGTMDNTLLHGHGPGTEGARTGWGNAEQDRRMINVQVLAVLYLTFGRGGE